MGEAVDSGGCGASSVVFPSSPTTGNVDESKNHLVEDYTHNMFASLRPGAVVLSFQWDYWVSAAHYYQLVVVSGWI